MERSSVSWVKWGLGWWVAGIVMVTCILLAFRTKDWTSQALAMAVSFSRRLLLLSPLLYQLVEAQFHLFPNGTHSTASLSQDCIAALNATITCDRYIQVIVSNDYYGSLGDITLQDSVCAAECGTSLASYHHSVALACTNSPQPWPGVPAIWTGDVIWATYNRTCLKDPATGVYCVGMFKFARHCSRLNVVSLNNLNLQMRLKLSIRTQEV